MVAADSLSAGDVVDCIDTGGTVDSKGESFDCAKQNGVNGSPSPPPLLSVDCNKSLLAKLLTRSNQNSSRKCGSGSNGAHYENLYDAVETRNEAGTTTASAAFSHGPPIAAEPGVDLSAGMLECPFLIETPTGYMSVESMLSALHQEDIFPAHGENTVNIIGQQEAVSSAAAEEISSTAAAEGAAPECTVPPDEQPLSNALLERIQRDTRPELQEDPEAVVLTRVTEDGRLEKLVLSSADVRALERKNEQWRKRRKTLAPPVAQVDVESPLGVAASLVTRVVQFGAPVDGAIAKLPFRRGGSDGLPGGASLEVALEQQLDQSPHENMFEELDCQFSMDCLMRDYVAYAEASETQLEHNYYANALKEADEECVAIGASYELSSMMLLERPLASGDDARAASDRLNNVASESAVGRCHDGLAIPDDRPTKALFNGRADPKKDTPSWTTVSTQRPTNGTSKGVPKATRRRGGRKAAAGSSDFGANALPFRSVKNASTDRPRRTYTRKAEASWSSVVGKRKMASLSGSPVSDSCLIEEIIVDEIS